MDSIAVSAVKGRVGVAIISLIGFGLSLAGYDLNAEMQSQLSEILVTIITGVSTIISIYSKIRETRKSTSAS